MSLLWSLSTLLLLAARSRPAHGAIVVENGLPILWAEASCQLSNLPQQENGEVTVNPWDYKQRMTLYRLLLASTDQYMSSMGPNATEGNPLWSFPLQLGWKLRSGRLMDPSGATTCGQESDPMCISGKSWWACVNYFVSVVPFLAAVQKGVIGSGHLQVRVSVPSDVVQDYCTSHADCSAKFPQSMAKWEAFFQGLMDLSTSAIAESQKRDEILGLMWAAQLTSLQEGPSACKSKLGSYSAPETSFASNWLSSVNYMAAIRFQSTVEGSALFMTQLPSRTLKKGDRAPNIPDLSTEENHSLYIFSWLNSMNNMLGGTLMKMWTMAMCSEKARENGLALLQNLVLNRTFDTTKLFSILSSKC